MISEQKNILNRLISLEHKNFERSTLSVTNQNNESLVNTPFNYDATPLMKSSKAKPCKSALKRNIFANAVIYKNASKFFKPEQRNSIQEQHNEQETQNLLQYETYDELMISEKESQIYEELDEMGVRFADPIEVQNNYYQKVRSIIFSHEDEISTNRFLTPKIAHSEKDLDTTDTSQIMTETDLESISVSKSADLKFNDSNLYLKRSTFKRPAVLEQYGKNSKSQD